VERMVSNTLFSGFPRDLFHFLEDLSKNNNREWFNANKERYRESVLLPMGDFICAMGKRLHKISDSFVADPRANGGSMFRIYRDTRFARDKRPYKENVACQFRHLSGKSAHAPGFYVHLQPGNVFIGAGIWKPPTPVLEKIRTAIIEQPGAWKKVVNSRAFTTRFGHIEGEQLKRPPRGCDSLHPFIEDLKRKSFFLKHSVKPSLALTPAFADEAEATFKDGAHLMAFVTAAIGLSF